MLAPLLYSDTFLHCLKKCISSNFYEFPFGENNIYCNVFQNNFSAELIAPYHLRQMLKSFRHGIKRLTINPQSSGVLL